MLPLVTDKLPQVFEIIKTAFTNVQNPTHTVFVWVHPVQSKRLSKEEKKNFIETLDKCQDLVAQHEINFLQYNTPWLQYINQYYVEKEDCLSPTGKYLSSHLFHH